MFTDQVGIKRTKKSCILSKFCEDTSLTNGMKFHNHLVEWLNCPNIKLDPRETKAGLDLIRQNILDDFV